MDCEQGCEVGEVRGGTVVFKFMIYEKVHHRITALESNATID